MRGCFSASDDRFVSCGRGWKFLFLRGDNILHEASASDLPWGPRAAPAPVCGPSHCSVTSLVTSFVTSNMLVMDY